MLLAYTRIHTYIQYMCIKSIRQIRRAHFTRCRTVFFFCLFRFRVFQHFPFAANAISISQSNLPLQQQHQHQRTSLETPIPCTNTNARENTQIRLRMREQTQSASKSCKRKKRTKKRNRKSTCIKNEYTNAVEFARPGDTPQHHVMGYL